MFISRELLLTGFQQSFTLARKQKGCEQALKDVQGLLQSITIAPLDNTSANKAFTYGMNDFEDALQACCAEAVGAIGIITGNIKDFKNSPIPAMTPRAFLAEMS